MAGVGGARAPSLAAYYVALGGVLLLLLLLLCYLVYFCISKVNELSKSESLTLPRVSQRPNQPYQPYHSYPIQPSVRAGATALAKLCGPTAGPTLDTHSVSEPTLSTDASEAGPTLEPTHANSNKEQG